MKKARFWIGILISIIALAFAFRQVDFSQVLAALSGISYWPLAASLVPILLTLPLRGLRWRLLFYPRKGLRLVNLVAVINIGYLLSNIFPVRLGDVARAYLIGDTEKVSRSSAFSTVVAERVLDALCAVGGVFVALPFAPLSDNMVRSGLLVGGVALAAVAVFVVLVRRREWSLRLLERILCTLHWPSDETMSHFWEKLAQRTRLRFLGRLPWADRANLGRMAGSLIDGFSGVTTARLGVPLLLLSVLIWVLISASYWIILLAFDPGQPYVAGVAVASITALGMTVPSSPGYIGVFHLLCQQTLVLFGMTAETALGYALVAHAFVYVVLSLLGLASMLQQHLTYADIQERISAEADVQS